VDIAWSITPDDLEAIEIGANVLGTGGGGNPYTVKLYARELLKQGRRIAVVDPLTLPDDALVVAVGGMGAPTVSIERIIRGDEFLYAVRALERHVGRPIDALISKEIGGSNSMRPMLAAALGDLPVVDGDGMGRAFPELQMCTFFIGSLPCLRLAHHIDSKGLRSGLDRRGIPHKMLETPASHKEEPDAWILSVSKPGLHYQHSG
jgi:uncharacterized protein